MRLCKYLAGITLILVVCGQLAGCGAEDPVVAPDGAGPGAVRDLMVFSNTSALVTLRWTAPRDTGGKVAAYDIRYSQSALSESNWESATVASSIPAPGAPGNRDECIVTGLVNVDTYYFGLKTRDSNGNWSELSNVVTTLDTRTYLVCADGSQDFTKIQDAISATRDGDKVQVCDGTYKGVGNRGIEFFGKAITVRSESGNPENCIIDCEGAANGFVFRAAEEETSVLFGFKVVNGAGAQGGAVYCGVPSAGIVDGASPTIANCIFANSPADQGAGIYCDWRGSEPTIMNCQFIGNTNGSGLYTREDVYITVTDCVFDGNARGAYIGHFNDVEFVNCTFRNHTLRAIRGSETGITLTGCTFENNTGGAVECHLMSMEISGCTFTGNSDVDGGAIYAGMDSRYDVTDCRFVQNSATEEGGAVFAREFNGLTMSDCWFEGNTAAEGAAVYIRTAWIGDPQFTRCTFYNNSASGPGGALRVVSEAVVRVDNSTFAENSASYGAVAYASGGGGPQVLLNQCIVANGTGGGTFRCDSPATATLTCTNVYGNSGGDWQSCILGQAGINGNISTDPLFCGAVGSGDLTIRSNSPCATAGCGLMGSQQVVCGP